MIERRNIFLLLTFVCPFLVLAKEKKVPTPVWTSAEDKTLPASFSSQGEYAAPGIGVQVIALSKQDFQAVVYPGGLPGAGWDQKARSLMNGTLQEDGSVAFSPSEGVRKYLGRSADEFSATKQFPPAGHQPMAATLREEKLTLNDPDGQKVLHTLAKVLRKSETLGAMSPKGAIVLFDGTSTDAFNGGRLDQSTGWLNTDGKDIRSKTRFDNYRMHIEFMMPFRPDARGQGRGNSGFYQVDHYEVQILDSFGLEGESNECGGIYKNAKPRVNMCFPPLTWQTYDITFRNAVVEDGVKVSPARITLKHNGVLIHDNVAVAGPTGGHRKDPEGTPGPIRFQGHGNPVQFKNVWVIRE